MSDTAVRMEHVFKKFRKGEMYDSLRDLISEGARRVFRRGQPAMSDREFWALQDVSFEVGRGEAFGIIGPNGAGKSTMLKLLSRVMQPTRGSFHVNGRLSALIELSAGFHNDLTGRENIYLHGTILGMTRREIASKLDEIVDFSGLEEFIDTPVKRYSSGMCARLGFAVAAHVNPDVLIVDEVLSVGDAHFQGKCVDRMREVIRNGATVLFVSHNMGLVAEFCSRSLLLDAGQVLTVGPTSEVISFYMNRLHQRHITEQRGPVVISNVCVRDEAGPRDRFMSGERAWIDIEVAVHKRCSSAAVGVSLCDEKHTLVFVTTTELLGHPRVNLNPGDVLRCTFELQLNYARGILYAKVTVGRFAVKFEVYDEWEAATAIHVSSPEVFFGPVNCFPKIVACEVHRNAASLPDASIVAAHAGAHLATL